MNERAWRWLAFAIVGLAVLAVNYDPVVKSLPDLPQGGGQPISEGVKQLFVLAAFLVLLTAIVVLLSARVAAVQAASNDFVAVVGPASAAAAAAFLVLYGLQSTEPGGLAVASLVVLGVAGLAAGGAPVVAPGSMSKLPVVATIAAIVLVGAYGAVVWVMFTNASTATAPTWERMVALFAGVESIGFAAVGALIGNQVQKVQTDAANDRLDQAGGVIEETKRLAGEIEKQRMATPSGGAAAGQGSAADGAITQLLEQLKSVPNPARRP